MAIFIIFLQLHEIENSMWYTHLFLKIESAWQKQVISITTKPITSSNLHFISRITARQRSYLFLLLTQCIFEKNYVHRHQTYILLNFHYFSHGLTCSHEIIDSRQNDLFAQHSSVALQLRRLATTKHNVAKNFLKSPI